MSDTVRVKRGTWEEEIVVENREVKNGFCLVLVVRGTKTSLQLFVTARSATQQRIRRSAGNNSSSMLVLICSQRLSTNGSAQLDPWTLSSLSLLRLLDLPRIPF